jgi:hypothetical protein
LPALQRKQSACRLLSSSEPPWFLGTMWSTSWACWCRVCQATAHLLAALHSESVKALAAQLQQLVALGVAQLYCCAEAFGYAAHQVVGAPLVAGDAVEGEPCPPSA